MLYWVTDDAKDDSIFIRKLTIIVIPWMLRGPPQLMLTSLELQVMKSEHVPVEAKAVTTLSAKISRSVSLEEQFNTR
jgi:hypothetical protein